MTELVSALVSTVKNLLGRSTLPGGPSNVRMFQVLEEKPTVVHDKPSHITL